MQLLSSDAGRTIRSAVAIAALVLVAAPGSALELAPGDLVIADAENGLLRAREFDGIVGFPDPERRVVAPTGVAIGVDPLDRTRRVVWVADPGTGSGGLYAVDPDDGSVLTTCPFSVPDPNVVDVVAREGGDVLFSIGPGLLLRHPVAWETDSACTGPCPRVPRCETARVVLAGVEALLGAPPVALALRDGGPELWIAAGAEGIFVHRLSSGTTEQVPGIPVSDGFDLELESVTGLLALSSGVVFVQHEPVFPFDCGSAGGVFAGGFGVGPLSQGGLLRCPVALARREDGTLFVIDLDRPRGLALLQAEAEGRIVRLELTNAFQWAPTLVASGPALRVPLDLAVVPAPEPRHGAVGITAAASLVLLGRRRSRWRSGLPLLRPDPPPPRAGARRPRVPRPAARGPAPRRTPAAPRSSAAPSAPNDNVPIHVARHVTGFDTARIQGDLRKEETNGDSRHVARAGRSVSGRRGLLGVPEAGALAPGVRLSAMGEPARCSSSATSASAATRRLGRCCTSSAPGSLGVPINSSAATSKPTRRTWEALAAAGSEGGEPRTSR